MSLATKIDNDFFTLSSSYLTCFRLGQEFLQDVRPVVILCQKFQLLKKLLANRRLKEKESAVMFNISVTNIQRVLLDNPDMDKINARRVLPLLLAFQSERWAR